MAACPTNLFAALQGIATAAQATTDWNAISLCQQIVELASFSLSPTYFSTGTSTTGPLVQEWYPAGSITPSHDTILDAGPKPGAPGYLG